MIRPHTLTHFSACRHLTQTAVPCVFGQSVTTQQASHVNGMCGTPQPKQTWLLPVRGDRLIKARTSPFLARYQYGPQNTIFVPTPSISPQWGPFRGAQLASERSLLSAELCGVDAVETTMRYPLASVWSNCKALCALQTKTLVGQGPDSACSENGQRFANHPVSRTLCFVWRWLFAPYLVVSWDAD